MTTPLHHHDNRYRLARALLLLNALTWLGLGIAHLLRSTGPNWVLALLLFANAAAFFSAALRLSLFAFPEPRTLNPVSCGLTSP